jgi:hypothetical protein
MTNTFVKVPARVKAGVVASIGLFAGSLLASCPSEPSPAPEPLMFEDEQPGTTTGGSAIDQVDVVSPDEALHDATGAIDSENVLDELNELEGEMEDN